MTKTATEVRKALVEALRLDLVGPTNDHAFARELLPQSPSVRYLTGFLAPSGASSKVRTDASLDSDGELDNAEQRPGGDDEETPDATPRRKGLFPASMGLSVLVPPETRELAARIAWGDYVWEEDGVAVAPPSELDHPLAIEGEKTPPKKTPETGEGSKKPKRERMGYRRIPREESVTCSLPKPGEKPIEIPIKGSDGLKLVVTARAIGPALQRLPKGTRSVSVFLVNRREPREKHVIPTFVFQVGLELRCQEAFVERVDPRYADVEPAQMDQDERVGDLHYRDAREYAVGHGVSAEGDPGSDGCCRTVRTTWIPEAEVERIVPSTVSGVELSMEKLGSLPDAAAAKKALSPLVTEYRRWLKDQRGKLSKLDATRKKTAEELISEAEWIAERIEHGINLLDDPLVLEAFRIANRAMARQARRRQLIQSQRTITEAQANEPKWYPFQLAFLLMVMRGIVDPTCSDRERVDLLFFPTGGGKTEAYLGLAAFTMVLRRLRDPGPTSAGVSVLMRYTLRLLTLDQLSRAAALMCALELERAKQPEKLGSWPFEIGLWVGRAATPNWMGRKNDSDEYSARARTLRYQGNSGRYGAPIPIEDCPWCGTKFQPDCFRLTPNSNIPTNLEVHCTDHDCDFSGERMLPIVAVDEPIYRRVPAFLIATVDKFAALPWTGQVGALFGRVDRYDGQGFYGPCNLGKGSPLGRPLLPPDLIIQDELHLISGPLGTIAGVYETAVDALSTRQIGGKTVRPKIVTSTATVRRAHPQIRALFGRADVSIFPSPALDRRDSFFSHTVPSSEKPPRLYIGLTAQGRSLKVVFLRSALALLSAAQREWDATGGNSNPNNPADPYMTLLGYFNSLRELGGSRRIVEDEISSRLQHYGRHRRKDPEDGTFVNRRIAYEPLELTSRVSTNEIADAKRRLSLPFQAKERVDVALATNMISVGLDIQRLGLMLVLGQPKTSGEYIQATSRVGRAEDKPGLVVTLLNVHKPRDRSHYERFQTYHRSFYRSVEATSVTPFSPRALDRALAATLVAMCRHGEAKMTAPEGASAIRSLRTELERWVDQIADRARNHSTGNPKELEGLAEQVRQRGRSLLDDWLGIANAAASQGSGIQYQQEVDVVNRRLLHEFLHPDLPKLGREFHNFRAARSMRDVEPSADLKVSTLVRGTRA